MQHDYTERSDWRDRVDDIGADPVDRVHRNYEWSRRADTDVAIHSNWDRPGAEGGHGVRMSHAKSRPDDYHFLPLNRPITTIFREKTNVIAMICKEGMMIAKDLENTGFQGFSA